ncbi:ImmA/IrrE family metallo-endopeptidase [Patescibacteria group bacterium]|nr:ImmA/IrrE family metallo-endopeptidase [Patescibacteria group bacterium]
MPNDIERKADEILDASGLRTIPVPIEEIAEHFKMHIGRAPSNDFSGMLIRKDGAALIGVNSTEHPRRQRFTIAHEIGHFFLHPTKNVLVDYRKSSKGTHRTLKEKEADIFAASLLMPARELTRDFIKVAGGILTDEEQRKSVVSLLATKYEVSEEAMNIRLLGLGMPERA